MKIALHYSKFFTLFFFFLKKKLFFINIWVFVFSRFMSGSGLMVNMVTHINIKCIMSLYTKQVDLLLFIDPLSSKLAGDVGPRMKE